MHIIAQLPELAATVCIFFSFFFSFFFEIDVAFSKYCILYHIAAVLFLLYGEYVVRFPPFQMVFFYLVRIFGISLLSYVRI